MMRIPKYIVERPWIKYYPNNKNPDIDVPNEPFFSALDRAIQQHPDEVAVIFLGNKIKYKKLGEYINRFTYALSRLGIDKGDKVAIYLLNSPQFIIAYFAILKLGATVVPMNPTYTASEVEYILKDSSAKTIISHDTNIGNITDVLRGTKVKNIIITNIGDFISPVKKIIGRMMGRIPTYKITKGPNIYDFKGLLRKSKMEAPSVDIDVDNDVASLPYTGGTSGIPKGVMLTHRNMVACRTQILSIWGPYLKQHHVISALLPFYHIYGQIDIVGFGLSRGDTLVIFPRLNVDALLKAIETYKITVFYGVPTLYNIILNHERIDLYDISSIEFCFSGADALPPEIAKAWKEKFGIDIIQGYGLTETSAVVSTNPPYRIKHDTVGIPVPNTFVALVKINSKEFLNIGDVGEIVVSGPQVTKGYWNKMTENKQAFFEAYGKKWFRTGDIGWMDEEGYIHFVDRAKDIIKYKGYLVSAAEVETVLYEHPAVKETCVIGIPDQVVGERIKAFVVLRDDAKGITSHDLIKWCRKKLAPYKVPRIIEIRDVLPKSSAGKILKRKLKDEEFSRLRQKI